MSDFITQTVTDLSSKTGKFARIIGSQKACIELLIDYIDGKLPYYGKETMIEVMKERVERVERAFTAANTGKSIDEIL